MSDTTTVAGAANPSPAPVCTLNLTKSVAVRLTGYGTVLFFVALGVILSLSRSSSYALGSTTTLIVSGFVLVTACVATIILHEAVHGLFFWIFGGKPQFGVGSFGWFCPYAYATAPGVPYTLGQMVVICLAPLVSLSAAALMLMWLAPGLSTIAAAAFLTNFSGAVGDLWLVRQLWRFHGCRELSLVDSLEGTAIYSPDPAATRAAAQVAATERGNLLSRLMLRWIIATVVMLALVSPLTIVMSLLGSENVIIGPPQFPLLEFHESSQGFSVEVDLNVIIPAGLVFALLSLLLNRRGFRSAPEMPPDGGRHPAFL
jgi:hypothetical protein